MILVYLGRWSYGRLQEDNNIFYKMKNDLTTRTWQDDIWCPIIIILFCTSDERSRRLTTTATTARTSALACGVVVGGRRLFLWGGGGQQRWQLRWRKRCNFLINLVIAATVRWTWKLCAQLPPPTPCLVKLNAWCYSVNMSMTKYQK
jgi:hypothetical protein